MKILTENRTTLVKKWTNWILETYPVETTKFLKAQKNQFSNPVGFTICNNAEKIFDELILGDNFNKIQSLLNEIIKIRAIQQFNSSDAVRFIFYLKQIIRDELAEEMQNPDIFSEYIQIADKIDKIALIAFDLYMQCKEKVFQIRVKEIKNNSLKSFEKIDSV